MLRIKKIVDTVGTFGNAEQFIALDTTFERFLRSKYSKKEITDINPERLIKTFHLKGIAFGNYVTQEERYFYLFKLKYTLEVLAKIKGSNNLGKGLLTVAFGSQGKPKSNAHYNPSAQLINLNRGRKTDWKTELKGEHSFIHEFAHFMDFVTGRNDEKMPYNFASEDLVHVSNNKNTIQYSEVVHIMLDNEKYMHEINHSKYLSSSWEIFARTFESAITHYIRAKHKTYSAYFDRSYTKPIYPKKDYIAKRMIDKWCVSILQNF